MPDLLAQVWSTPGLIWLALTIGVAGVVRGFCGFGTALIFVPIAGIFLPAETVITIVVLMGVASNIVLIPRAWRQGARGEVGLLALAAMVTVPLGLILLDQLSEIAVRWMVAGVAGTTLAVLVAGWRFSGQVNLIGLLLIGAAAGVIGGMTGITGPVVIMFYLAGQSAAQRVRANTILFLAALDVVIVANLLLRDTVGLPEVMLALTLAVPYFVTTLIGQALFDPKHERMYRAVAYAVIALAVIGGLPLWG